MCKIREETSQVAGEDMNDLTISLPTPNNNGGNGKKPAHVLAILKKNQFKTKEELGGQLDPRINKGGRPKILKEESAQYLGEKDKSGKTNARVMIEAMGELAKKQLPHSVGAFKEIRQTAEPNEEDKGNTFNIGEVNLGVLAMVQRLVGK